LFTAKMEDGTREWRTLRNEKVHHLYSTKLCSHDLIREDEMGRIYAFGTDEKCIQHFGDKS